MMERRYSFLRDVIESRAWVLPARVLVMFASALGVGWVADSAIREKERSALRDCTFEQEEEFYQLERRGYDTSILRRTQCPIVKPHRIERLN